jgi:hypothetical protein
MDAMQECAWLYVGLSVVISKQEGVVTFITLCWQFGIAWWPPTKPGVCFHIVNNPGFMYCQFVKQRLKKGPAGRGNHYSV